LWCRMMASIFFIETFPPPCERHLGKGNGTDNYACGRDFPGRVEAEFDWVLWLHAPVDPGRVGRVAWQRGKHERVTTWHVGISGRVHLFIIRKSLLFYELDESSGAGIRISCRPPMLESTT
jgi:hypothetical protein